MKNTLASNTVWLSMLVFCIAIGFFGTLYVYTDIRQTPPVESILILETTPFSLQPPAQSLKGTLTGKIGEVQHKTREINEFTDATPSGSIVIGESIATGKSSSATIDIPSLVSLSMEQNSELVFSNIFRENSVFLQKSGNIQYTISSAFPVSVRALHALVQAKQSIIQVNIVDEDIRVSTIQGEASIGIVDLDNTTHVYTIPEKNKALIDDTTRSVTLISPRE